MGDSLEYPWDHLSLSHPRSICKVESQRYAASRWWITSSGHQDFFSLLWNGPLKFDQSINCRRQYQVSQRCINHPAPFLFSPAPVRCGHGSLVGEETRITTGVPPSHIHTQRRAHTTKKPVPSYQPPTQDSSSKPHSATFATWPHVVDAIVDNHIDLFAKAPLRNVFSASPCRQVRISPKKIFPISHNLRLTPGLTIPRKVPDYSGVISCVRLVVTTREFQGCRA